MKLNKILTKPFESLGRSSGMALPEAMIAMFLVGLSLAVTVNKMGEGSKAQKGQRAITTLAELSSRMSSASVTLPAIMKYAHGSIKGAEAPNQLKSCLKTPGTCLAGAGIHLVSASGEVFSGKKGNPLHLDYKGKPCKSPKSNVCAFEVSSFFKPICSGLLKGKAGEACSVAQALLITTEIAPIKSFWGSDGVARNPFPDGNPLKIQREVNVSIENLVKKANAICSKDDALFSEFINRRKAAHKKTERKHQEVFNADTWHAQEFPSYLRGISWSGDAICESILTIASLGNSSWGVPGDEGEQGDQGRDGPRGPQGSKGSCRVVDRDS